MKRKPTIHLLMACTNYESDAPVRAFADATAAATFKDKVDKYHAKRPESPAECIDTPENDVAHEQWWNKLQSWSKRHPAGESNAFRDHFAVVELPYTP